MFIRLRKNRDLLRQNNDRSANGANVMRIQSVACKIAMTSDKIYPLYFRGREKGKRCTAPSSGPIGRNFQIELELGASKADTTQVSPAGLAGK